MSHILPPNITVMGVGHSFVRLTGMTGTYNMECKWLGPPMPDVSADLHAGLTAAVVEEARKMRREYSAAPRFYETAMIPLLTAVDALNAALKPVDPVGDLLKQATEAVNQLRGQDCWSGASLLHTAIAAVKAARNA